MEKNLIVLFGKKGQMVYFYQILLENLFSIRFLLPTKLLHQLVKLIFLTVLFDC
mgnify:CR=1 FL=1